MMLPVKRLVCCALLALLLVVSTGAGRATATESGGAPGKARAAEGSKALDLADIIARARPAVVVVLAQDAKGEKIRQGSGFIVTPDGLVVTNWHVVRGASSALVKRERSWGFDTVEGVVAWDAEHDFAILKIDGNRLATMPEDIVPIRGGFMRIAGKGLATVPMGDSDNVRQGDRVLVLGSPQGLENTASDGIVSAVRELPGALLFIQSASAYPRKPHNIGHVAISLGNGYILEARSSRYGVTIGPARRSRPRAHPDLLTVAIRGHFAERMRELAESHGMSLSRLLKDAVVVYQGDIEGRYKPGASLQRRQEQQTQGGAATQ
jgi:hypothetical protein